MQRLLVGVVALVFVSLASVSAAWAHCEVPCGIYADQLRFERMLEDQTTVAKAMGQIEALAESDDALSRNQLARWVTTKESHATNVQQVVAQYFLTQRIKPAADDAGRKKYVGQLVAAHAVMRAAMKCKQTVDPEDAAALRRAVLDLYRAYEGKEPEFE